MTLKSLLLAIAVLIISAIINIIRFKKMNIKIAYLEDENQKLKIMYMDLHTRKMCLERELEEVKKYDKKN